MAKIELRDEREPGYFTIDNEIIDELAPAMGAYGLSVYMVLCRFANRGVAFPSLDTIATRLGISRNTVKKALEQLEAAKVIHIQHRPGNPKKGIPAQSSIYSILKVKKTGGRSGDDLRVGQEMTEGRSNGDPGVGQIVTPNKPNTTKTNLISGSGETLEPTGTRVNGHAAADPKVVIALRTCGQSADQARRYAVLQEFAPSLLDRLSTWYQQKKADPRVESAGRLLASFLKNGDLPDDLPPPPKPAELPIFDSNGEILNREAYEREYSKKRVYQ